MDRSINIIITHPGIKILNNSPSFFVVVVVVAFLYFTTLKQIFYLFVFQDLIIYFKLYYFFKYG